MEAQRERARAGAAFGPGADAEAAAIYARLAAELPRVEFVGHDTLAAPARILAIIDTAGGRLSRVREATEGAEVEMILDRTPAYAESGGQVGDTGTIAGRGGRGQLLDTYYRGSKLIVHRVRVVQGGFHENEEVAVSVETPRRQGLRQHHTGTHLLHSALRRILGPHVAQAGSLVAPDHLRFDFSHGAQVKDREIEQIEELVNEQVQANVEVARMEMDLDEALRMGALALFGEKYGDRVRVVKIGDFSTELCWGTHLERTGELGLVKVTTEGAVASGVRRIEAVAGGAALEHRPRQEAALPRAAARLQTAPLEVPKRLAKLLEEQRLLEKQLAAFEVKLARSRAEELVRAARQVNGVAVVTGRIDGLDADGLRAVADTLRDRLGPRVVCLRSVLAGKGHLRAAVTTDLVKRVQAGRLMQEGARAVGGRGGGRPRPAQGGGPRPS